MTSRPKSRWNIWTLLRLVILVLVGVSVVVAYVLGPSVFYAYVPRPVRRNVAISFLIGAQVVYGAGLLACLVAIPVLSRMLIRSRRQRIRRPVVARFLLLSASFFFGLLMVEGGLLAWRLWSRRATEMPSPSVVKTLSSSSSLRSNDELLIVVVGESSAEGVPYHRRLSVGEIVAWQLRRAIPNRKIRVEVQAQSGINLTRMHARFAELRRTPDVVIVYAGHNEFSSRYAWFHGWPYYDDTQPVAVLDFLKSTAYRISPLCALIQDTIQTQSVDAPPPLWVTRRLVDLPVYTPQEYASLLDDFRSRLDSIAAYCRGAKAVAVMVSPPGNDSGFEPNRSFLAPQTTKAEREVFTRDFQVARDGEASDPAASVKLYRALLKRQPTFAEGHYRLARLLEQAGFFDEAYESDIKARNLDGLPMRCPSDFQEAYRQVATKQHALLVDGQELFHKLSPTGLLNDEFFNDAMHPSLRGHTALAQAILDQLHTRPELGWPEGSASPKIDPLECAKHFNIDAEGWSEACDSSALIWRIITFARHDPTERIRKTLRFDNAAVDLRAGKSVESLNVPGLGLAPLAPIKGH